MKPKYSSELIDIASDLSETVLDQFINDPLIKDIPIVGTAVNLAKIGKTISDRLFLSKVKKFLLSISVTSKEKEEFINQLESDAKLKAKTQEAVLFLINRADSFDKIEILGHLFQAFIRSQIDINKFRKLSFAVDLAFVDDLALFINANENESKCYESLVRTGLTSISRTSYLFSDDFAQSSIDITELGKLFLSIMRNNANQ